MFGICLKRFFCKHEYKLLTTYEKDIDSGYAYDKQTICIVYCPKCKKQLSLVEWEYNALMHKQEIDKEFRQ